MTIEITCPDDTRGLHHHYSGQTAPQGVYLELDPGADPPTLALDWNGETGNAVPFPVWHGRVRRYHLGNIPTTEAARRLLDEVAPLAARVVAGYGDHWDGSNYVGRLTEDATRAEEEIERLCEALEPGDYLQVWEPGDWLQDTSPADVGLSAASTDAEVEEIAERLTAEAWADGRHVPGLETLLEEWRRDLRDDD